jgi:hypothetical protein
MVMVAIGKAREQKEFGSRLGIPSADCCNAKTKTKSTKSIG